MDPGDEDPDRSYSEKDLDKAFEEGLEEARRILRKRYRSLIERNLQRQKLVECDVSSAYMKGQYNGFDLLRELVSDDIGDLILRKKGL